MLIQLLLNSLANGLLLAVVAIGFGIIYASTRIFHMAHGALYVGGGYFFWYTANTFDNGATGVVSAFLIALFLIALISVAIEMLVYRSLKNRNAAQVITMITSLGIYLFLVNLFALLFSNENKSFTWTLTPGIHTAGLIIPGEQLLIIAVCLLLLTGLMIWSRTDTFLQLRGLNAQPGVALLLGVPVDRIRLISMILGGSLAAIGGMLKLIDTGIQPYAGMGITLSAAVAIVLGGQQSIKGMLLAAILISGLQTAVEFFLSSTWRDGITYLLLIIVLLLRTEGLIASKLRIEER